MFTHIIDKPSNTGINLPTTKKNILFALSGGADSAILFYMLCKFNKELGNLHTIIPFTVPRGDDGEIRSKHIVQWVNNKLGVSVPDPIIKGDKNLHHSVVVKTVIKDLLDTQIYDLLFVAENKVYDTESPGAPQRAKTNSFRTAQLPFWHLTKDQTISFYYKENIPELLELTHSCTEQASGKCNMCYQCKEREWAFSKLMKQDPKS